MKGRLEKLQDAVDGLTLRERLFVLAAALTVVVGLWEALLAAPLEAREQIAIETIETTRARIDQLNRTLELTAQGISEGMQGRLERLRALRERVAANEESVRIFTSDLVDPAQMRDVLEELIRAQPGLELVSINNRPGEPMIDDADEPEAAGPRLYRHALVLELEGSYLDALAYLREVERLPWQLYWSRLSVRTEQYPLTRVSIELDTLSLEEEWIGV